MTMLSLESLADRINREHAAALRDAESAIDHARLVGKLLLEARERCEYGDWEDWLAEHCPDIAGRTAQKYMQIARHPALEAKSIGEALLKIASPRQPNNPLGRAAPQTTDSQQKDPPISSQAHDAGSAESVDLGAPESPAPPVPDEPEYDPLEFAAQDAEALALAERDWQERMDRVLSADDRLAAAAEEIKRQSLEISVLKLARDGFMDGKAEVERLLRKEQSKNAKLEKRLKALGA